MKKHSSNLKKEEKHLNVSKCCLGDFTVIMTLEDANKPTAVWKTSIICSVCKKETEPIYKKTEK